MDESPTRTLRATRRRYRPSVELGHGATATVWRARDGRTGRDVALKRFHPHLLSDPVTRDRIEHEATAASRLNHPNIVSPVDVVDDRDGLALVFPYVEGATLAARVVDGPRLTPREAARIALDIADALAVAHAHGVVHRDVKPANILLGADGRARLLDFGISRALEETDASRLTGAGLAIGTLPYMAPEQLAAGPTTPASDVYALGAVLYEMLGGRKPYAAASPVTLAREQAQPPARIAGAPHALVQLALDAMAADAAARPDAAQLARGLRAILDGRGEPEADTVAFAPPRRGRPVLGWAALALAALVAAALVPLVAAGIATAPTDAPQVVQGEIALVPPSGPPPTPTSAPLPAQPPVLGATTADPPSKPGGREHKSKHHRKHRERHRH